VGAAAAGCVNWGFPTLADTDIPEILPTGICTYEHVVANVAHEEMVQRSVEVRGLKDQVADIDIPCAFGPAYEGERVRGADLYMPDGRRQDPGHRAGEDGRDERDRRRQGDRDRSGHGRHQGRRHPAAGHLSSRWPGREMQADFEPILERQIHHLINYIQGIMHIGQRDIAWIRVEQGRPWKRASP
jgi:acetyl-CoA synthase